MKWDLFFNGPEKKPPLGPADAGRGADPALRQRRDPQQRRALPLPGPDRALHDLQRAVAEEAARARGGQGLRRARPARGAPAAAAARPRARAAAPVARRLAGAAGEVRVSDPSRDAAAVRELYESFVEERRRAGEKTAPAFESFREPDRQADRADPVREGGRGRRLPARDQGRQGLAQGPDRQVRPRRARSCSRGSLGGRPGRPRPGRPRR